MAAPKQGSEAVANQARQLNAKAFHYPPQGFQTPLENSLLYTMVRESSIFPAEAVLEAIEQEDYVQYFFINETDHDKRNSTNTISGTATESDTATHPPNVSYAQLTALLALAGEEWEESSKVPERLCQCISKQIVHYANQHDYDRQQELQDLIDPLLKYAQSSRNQQNLRLLPWFAALTVSTVNPLAFYTTYMTMIAVHGENLSKRDKADRNTFDIVELSNRKANVEKASLLDEDYNDEDFKK
jgi:lysyl-tRNA synthetase class I